MSIFDELNTNVGGGLQGPFINWQSKIGKHAPAENWTLRSKDDDNTTSVALITSNFEQGVVFDYNTIKLGWEKWAPMGQQTDTKWSPTLNLAAFPRPSDEKRMNEMGKEVFYWQKTFAIRIAIGGGVAATWNQSAFGAMLAFEGFVEQLKASGAQHPGKLPLVKHTGVRDEYGGSRVPVLQIVDWIEAPDCLRQQVSAAQAINTAPTVAPTPAVEAPAPAAAPTPASAPAAAVPEAARF